MVDAGLAHVDEVGHCYVHGAQCELLGDRVNIGGFVDHRLVFGAEDGADPFWCRLLAGDEAFGAELSGRVSNVLCDGGADASAIVKMAVC